MESFANDVRNLAHVKYGAVNDPIQISDMLRLVGTETAGNFQHFS